MFLFVFFQDQNVFDSKKKVKLTSAEGVEYKLAKKQLQAIEINKALLAMYTNQVITQFELYKMLSSWFVLMDVTLLLCCCPLGRSVQ